MMLRLLPSATAWARAVGCVSACVCVLSCVVGVGISLMCCLSTTEGGGEFQFTTTTTITLPPNHRQHHRCDVHKADLGELGLVDHLRLGGRPEARRQPAGALHNFLFGPAVFWSGESAARCSVRCSARVFAWLLPSRPFSGLRDACGNDADADADSLYCQHGGCGGYLRLGAG